MRRDQTAARVPGLTRSEDVTMKRDVARIRSHRPAGHEATTYVVGPWGTPVPHQIAQGTR